MTLALIMAGLGGLSSIYGATKPIPELQSDFWRKYYSQGDIELAMSPMRSALEAREGEARGRTYERWGGRGLVSGAGARADIKTISRDTERLLAETLARVTAGEKQKAVSLGLSQFQRDLQKAMGERQAWSQLGSTLMAPGAIGLGGYLGTLGQISQYPPGAPITSMTEANQRLADILAGRLGPGY